MPTDVLDVYRRVYVDRQLLARRAALAARRAWRTLDPSDIRRSWVTGDVGDQVRDVVVRGQQAAAQSAAAGVGVLAAAQGFDDDAVAEVRPGAYAGYGSQGGDLGALLDVTVIRALQAIAAASAQGWSPSAAQRFGLKRGGRLLVAIVGSQVLDSARAATSTATASRRSIQGHTRVLSPPSCSRCAVLAGRWYRWSDGFQRHPRCDCGMVPSNRDALARDPKLWTAQKYFDSLTRLEQDRIFTADGAESIRLGADISQVVNARRGMTTTAIGGRKIAITTDGTTLRGLAGKRLVLDGSPAAKATTGRYANSRYRVAQRPRLLPEQIFAVATSREDAIRLLIANGYLI